MSDSYSNPITPSIEGSRSFDNFSDNRTIWLGSTAIGLGLPTNLTKGLAARRLFRVPKCHTSTMHLQTSTPSPGFEPRPYGTAVSITNNYTGWVA
ncbi:hypothetical protein TNCV_3008441 [Trichonephila clavipes]|nr:hypothetical protein TNCV_3008441 [Trichonephila clavipes]